MLRLLFLFFCGIYLPIYQAPCRRSISISSLHIQWGYRSVACLAYPSTIRGSRGKRLKKEQKIFPVILGTGYLSAAVHLFLMPIHLALVYLGSQTCCRLSFIPSQYCITGVHTGYVSLEQMRRDIKCCGTVHDEGNHRAPWASVNKGSSLSPLKSQLKKKKNAACFESLSNYS